jgi:hypothetical protein
LHSYTGKNGSRPTAEQLVDAEKEQAPRIGTGVPEDDVLKRHLKGAVLLSTLTVVLPKIAPPSEYLLRILKGGFSQLKRANVRQELLSPATQDSLLNVNQ